MCEFIKKMGGVDAKIFRLICQCKAVMRRILFLSLWLCGTPCAAAKNLSLDEIVQFTIAHNVNVDTAAMLRVLQRYDVAVAENFFDPKFEFSGQGAWRENEDHFKNYSQNKILSVQPGTRLNTKIGTQFQFFWENEAALQNSNGDWTKTFTTTPSISITQPLLKNFGTTVNTNNLQTSIEQEAINLLTFKNLLNTQITNSINAYYALIQAKEALQIQQDAYKKAVELKKRTEHLIKEGRLANNEIYEVASQVSQQALNISSAKLAVTQARLTLLDQLDLSPQEAKDFDIENKVYLSSAFPRAKLAETVTLQNSVPYQQTLVSIKQSERQLFIAENQNEWALDLNLSHQLNGGQSNDGIGNAFHNMGGLDAHATSATLSFTMPLGNDLARKEQVVSAKVSLLQNKRSERALQREIENQVITNLESIKLLKETLKNQEATLALRRKSADSASLKYNEGMISSFELTTVQDTLTAAEQSVIDSKIGLAQSLANFDLTLGTTLDTWQVQFETQDRRYDAEITDK